MKKQIEYIISQLQDIYSKEESRELAYWIIEEALGITRVQILCGCKDTQNIPNIEIILQKLRAHEPIQYIFERTEWKGLNLRVTPATLIPRPETAELVDWVIDKLDATTPHTIMDIGTGSGCIAIALKKHCPQWRLIGADISNDALVIAKDNAIRNDVEVEWINIDVLAESPDWVDVIVSNPPYICHKEKAEMEARVLDYEPHSALFVPDADPLLFYRRIASMRAAKQLFFEINEAYGKNVCEMLQELGYKDITLKYDMYGKERMVYGAINR
jgi:release factor glutamine methyltransferase